MQNEIIEEMNEETSIEPASLIEAGDEA